MRRRAATLVVPALLLVAGAAIGYLAGAGALPVPFLGRPSGRTAVAPSDGAADASPANPSPADPSLAVPPPASAEMKEKLEALLSLGYAAGYVPARERTGVIARQPASSPGYNLLVSGHAPAAELLDPDGRVVHRWERSFEQVWPAQPLKPGQERRASFWKRVHLFPNGDLIGMFEGFGLVKLDRGSRILWRFEGPVHHDLDVDEEGRILVLLRRARLAPRISSDEPILEDFLAILDASGRLRDEISILSALERSSYAILLKQRWGGGDFLHTNTVTLLDGRHEGRAAIFRKGNVLMAVRNLDLVCILDPRSRRVVWAVSGLWVRPHEPILLENGRMLIFDNEGWQRRGRKLSRVFEFDPLTQEIVWSYTGPPDFHSAICGLAQRLPNGNTLVTVSTEGRVIEVAPDGRVVWEFLNPHSTRVEGEERVATIFDMVRLPEARVKGFLPGAS